MLYKMLLIPAVSAWLLGKEFALRVAAQITHGGVVHVCSCPVW